jgi:hypothetical protein
MRALRVHGSSLTPSELRRLLLLFFIVKLHRRMGRSVTAMYSFEQQQSIKKPSSKPASNLQQNQQQ